jgi:hypothetical protein
MQKLIAVEEARRVLNIGKEWSIWRWLIEKKRVRTAADAGTAALDELEKKVKAGWSDDLKKAYREADLEARAGSRAKASHSLEKAREEARDIDPAIKLAVRRVKEADVIAYDARMGAEATFDEAERCLSGAMAREGAEKALEAYDLREKAIRRAEAAMRVKASVSQPES